MNKQSQGQMFEIVITKDSIYSKMCDLNINKSPGPDMLHPRVLYELRDVITYPLFLICDNSLRRGKVPEDWKLAEVTAIHKKRIKIG